MRTLALILGAFTCAACTVLQPVPAQQLAAGDAAVLQTRDGRQIELTVDRVTDQAVVGKDAAGQVQTVALADVAGAHKHDLEAESTRKAMVIVGGVVAAIGAVVVLSDDGDDSSGSGGGGNSSY